MKPQTQLKLSTFSKLSGLIVAITLVLAGQAKAQIYTDGSPTWIGGNGKIYTIGAKVGINTNSPIRGLHLKGAGHRYMRATSTGGTQYHTYVAGMELRRVKDNGQSIMWDLVNQGTFKIRRNTSTLFQLDLNEAQLGTQAKKITLNIWGKHVFQNSGQLYDGALALQSSSGGSTSILRLDGSKIESENDLYLNWFSDENIRMAQNGNVGIGSIYSSLNAKLGVKSDGWQFNLINGSKSWRIGVSNDDWTVGEGKLVFSKSASSNAALMVLTEQGRVGIGMTTPNRTLDVDGSVRASTLEVVGSGSNAIASLSVNGKTSTNVLQITGGADLAEPFEITNESTIQPGTIVAIDPLNAGRLKMATTAYDKTVAGIVSGAGNIHPGMVMGQEGSIADGEHPVALTGRVYAKVDASYGAIQPGDLLTTSNTPGHAMRVGDSSQAQGAIIGKAMTALEIGQGLVLVLVSLQ